MNNLQTILNVSDKVLWGKLSRDVHDGMWLPLHIHMRDTQNVVLRLWDEWVSKPSRDLLCTTPDGMGVDPETCRKVIGFLAATHDLGKVSPSFQRKVEKTEWKEPIMSRLSMMGLNTSTTMTNPDAIPHSLISQLILERHGIDRTLSVIVGGHHGVPPNKADVKGSYISGYRNNTGFSDEDWVAIQDRFLEYTLEISGTTLDEIQRTRLGVASQTVASGLIIMADWIASNEVAFPLIGFDEFEVSDDIGRADYGWSTFNLPKHEGLVHGGVPRTFIDTFGFDPRPLQRTVMEAAQDMDSPGLLIIEAPMGEGKTEAALSAAEILASRFGHNGLFFALPTQATANGLFPRVEQWVKKCSDSGTRTIFLAHGKSRFNSAYNSLPHLGWGIGNTIGTESVIVHEWFSGKKGMLSDIIIGTIDQILMTSLKGKHLSLRHLGISGKVVIIDECHAYDCYMGSYLTKTLEWLGLYRVPVIIMSATLPPSRRDELIWAYSGKKYVSNGLEGPASYPLITSSTSLGLRHYTSDCFRDNMDVKLEWVDESSWKSRLEEVLDGGGYAGIIVNTVKKAQAVYDIVRDVYPNDVVLLLHSGYTNLDRASHEEQILESMSTSRKSPPFRQIVVGTQVLEQSLDLDFDVMFTDLCPVDLLIQRLGRLHRHPTRSLDARPRKLVEPRCFIMDMGWGDFDSGSEYVYGKYQLMNSRVLLDERITLPHDIPIKVRMAYSEQGVDVFSPYVEEYLEAKRELELHQKEKESKAKVFQIQTPSKVKDLVGWLEYPPREDDSGRTAEATVRDTDGSLEVILVCRDERGKFHIPPWVEGYGMYLLPEAEVPDELARCLVGCTITIPHGITHSHGKNCIPEIIGYLQEFNKQVIPPGWSNSMWLRDGMFIVLDEDNKAMLGGHTMAYDSQRGVSFDG